MPFLKIYYKKEISDETVNKVNDSIHKSLMDCFDVPEDDIFHIWLPFNAADSKIDSYYVLSEGKKRSDSFLYIDILCAEGRTTEQKNKLYLSVSGQIADKTNISAEDIFITLKEIPRENWSFGEGKAQAITEKREKKSLTAGNSGGVILNGNPVLDSYTRDMLFGEVWMDETLVQKTRSFITLTALAAIGNTEQMKFHIQTAYKNGVKREELIALTTHLAFYIGWPQAVQLLNQISDDFKYNPEF